ncbi:MAG: GAF domain-containing protein [Acidiferrobacterales bacterium]
MSFGIQRTTQSRETNAFEAQPDPNGTSARVLGFLSTKFSLGKLKWVASLVPIVFFLTWEYVWHFPAHSLVSDRSALFMAMVASVALVGAAVVLGQLHLLDRAQRLLREQNRELSQRTVALEALYDLGTRLSGLHDVGTIKETAVQRARQLLGADTAGLALLHEPSQTVHWELLAGSRGEPRRTFQTKLGECVGGDVIQSGEPVILENVDPEAADLPVARHLLAVEELRAALVVPVRVGGSPIGAMLAGHRTPYSFQLSHLKLLLGLANQVAAAINNARLYERLAAYSAIEERERLAREMHDGLAQLLGHVTGRAGAALELLRQGKVDQTDEHLARLCDVAQDAYLEVRQCIFGLRTKPAESRGFVQVLKAYLKRFGEQARIDVHLEAPTDEFEFPETARAAEVQAIRIVQEGLSNVRKHARAKGVWVTVEARDTGVAVTVRDDGDGFDLKRAAAGHDHFGLATMRERAESVGGTFTIETEPGHGTSVSFWLPLKAAA